MSNGNANTNFKQILKNARNNTIFSSKFADQPTIPKTSIGIYRNLLGIGKEVPKVRGGTITRIDLENAILSDSLLNAKGYQQLYAHINEWPWHYHLYRKPKEEMPLEMQAFLIDRLSREFTFQYKYQMEGKEILVDNSVFYIDQLW